MKKFLIAMGLAAFGFASAQATDAFSGRGDQKAQIGANFQKWGTGIQASLDYGLGESFSVGVVGTYILSYQEIDANYIKPSTDQRFDLRARASAHIGDVIGLPQNVDIYPGLDLGLKNFGGHIGARYFFNKGLGLFSEIQFPFAKYKNEASYYQKLNNQFNFTVGASFDISRRPVY